jgi:hypothetical protein
MPPALLLRTLLQLPLRIAFFLLRTMQLQRAYLTVQTEAALTKRALLNHIPRALRRYPRSPLLLLLPIHTLFMSTTLPISDLNAEAK